MIGEYIDNSKEILQELGVEIDEENGDYGDESDCSVDDIAFKMDSVNDDKA